ncbi:glycosyltransferase family protein 64 C3-like, partial [Phalaenopsis equestris]|uniref:glycosyltransferase family protein 64 C3-like n=1 Tax=Phalaenopsis equestris TaxID=78828 RepID=UPI0009E3BDBA
LLLSRFILISDDDISPSPHSLSLALSLANQHPLSLLGFFPRSHAFDLPSKSWIYTLHSDRYSILLTKLMLLRADYLHKYSCWTRLSPARAVVDRERNCEDILMNFVAAMESGEGPLLVGGRVRDYGDPRNRGKGETEIGRVGLSSRKEHWGRRGSCITEFHRLLGVMPLRYSYGKVVGEIGEQGVCKKSGKLVFCDED